jgi:hypothetical protein
LEQVRAFLREAVGESTFEIWLASLELIAVDVEGTLIVSTPLETAGWVARRFGRVLDGAAHRAGRGLRIADGVERKAAESLAPAAAVTVNATQGGVSADARSRRGVGSAGSAADVQPARSGVDPSDASGGSRDDQSTGRPTYRSAYPSSYTDVYTQAKEVS